MIFYRKTFLACMLVLCMLVSMFSGVTADTPGDVIGTEYEEAVEALAELEILKGYEDGTFKPEATITRAEFSAIIARVIAFTGDTGDVLETADFTDVAADHWAADYINSAFSKGIINGYGNGLFGPEDKVTYEQVIKMIVCTLGFEEEALEKGAYPDGYIAIADEKGITKDSEGSIGQPANRGLVAKLIWGSLDDVSDTDADSGEGTTYYVSPAGSDTNPGTEDKPWQTFRKAAITLKAGDTAVFEDGTYMETAATVIANSGTEDAPIIFKARNKHKAKLVYPEAVRLVSKIVVLNKQFITIRDMEITQLATATEEDSSKTMDIMMQVVRSNNISLIGNKIYNTFEEGIKSHKSSGLLIEGNIIYDTAHEGIDFVNVVDSIIRDNEISEVGRVGIMVKGGSKSIQIYNNYIHNKHKRIVTTAITIGGSTDANSAYDSSVNGYEGYNLVAWNNVVVAETPGIIHAGISFYGAKYCAAYNNIIIGTEHGMEFNKQYGTRKQWPWDWDPVTVSPVSKNNIIMDCTQAAYYFNDAVPEGMESDYNLFFNSPDPPFERNSLYQNPLFADKMSDWTPKSSSPLIGAGVPMPKFIGYSGQEIDTGYDKNWVKRTEPWDMGIYAVNSKEQPIEPPTYIFLDPELILTEAQAVVEDVPSKPMPDKGTVVLDEKFSAATAQEDWTIVTGSWKMAGGVYKQEDAAVARSTTRYNDGFWWTDYEASADVLSPTAEDDKNTGILFRANAEMTNMYAFRFCAENKLEFAMWNGGSFVSIQKWDFNYKADTYYRLKVVAVGQEFTFYVDDEEVLTITDFTHARGTVGLYTYKQGGEFDNVSVISAKED